MMNGNKTPSKDGKMVIYTEIWCAGRLFCFYIAGYDEVLPLVERVRAALGGAVATWTNTEIAAH